MLAPHSSDGTDAKVFENRTEDEYMSGSQRTKGRELLPDSLPGRVRKSKGRAFPVRSNGVDPDVELRQLWEHLPAHYISKVLVVPQCVQAQQARLQQSYP